MQDFTFILVFFFSSMLFQTIKIILNIGPIGHHTNTLFGFQWESDKDDIFMYIHLDKKLQDVEWDRSKVRVL